MAKTILVPSGKVLLDGFRTLKKVHWKKRGGTWCSAAVFLGNLDQGGDATLILSGLKPGVEDFIISLGANGLGNSAFWDVRNTGTFVVSNSHFNQTVMLSDGTLMQAYGVYNFDGGDNHNGSEFFFRTPGFSFTAVVSATPQVAAPPNAHIWEDPFSPTVQTVLDDAGAITQGSATFEFTLTESDKHVTFIG